MWNKRARLALTCKKPGYPRPNLLFQAVACGNRLPVRVARSPPDSYPDERVLRWAVTLVLVGGGWLRQSGLSRFIASSLFGIAATDAPTLVGPSSPIVMAVGTLACSRRTGPVW